PADGRLPLRELLRDDGRRRSRDRVPLRRARPDPDLTPREGDGSERDLELHDVPEHRLPRARRGARLAVRPHRRATDAEDDGQADGARPPRPCGPRPRSLADRDRHALDGVVRVAPYVPGWLERLLVSGLVAGPAAEDVVARRV